jgi:hypothetical protein
MNRIVLALVLAIGGSAVADPSTTVGVFAPTAPFPSTAARVELASHLGEQLAPALGGKATGKVFARAADFAAAVKRGEVTVALVDAAYLAAVGGNYTVVAAEAPRAWLLVSRGDKISGLKGKRLLVPSIGGREVEFALNVMLGGEVGHDFFGKIEAAPDTASALAALGLGRADAAMVPAGSELPQGASQVLALPVIAGPVLVIYGTTSAQQRSVLATTASGFHGDTTLGGLREADGDAIQQIARRFSASHKRGPLAVPAIRMLVGDLVEGRTFAVERTPAIAFVAR